MAIASGLSKTASIAMKLSGRPLEVTSKLLGAGTIASVAYDSHINGIEKSIVNDRIETADRYEHNYRQYMSLGNKSQTVADGKNMWFRMQQTFSWTHILSRTSGYLAGSVQTILGNLPEIALSILALKTKNHKFLGKTAGILLGINAIKTVLYDIIGIGKSKNI